MTKENGVKELTDMVADFVAHIGKKLPDDVVEKLEELGSKESAALPKVLYETMTKNQELAVELNRPSCQDTGVLQFWLKCGTNFPYINELEALLKEAVVQATFAAPLRHNSVETFDEYNTKKNVGKGTPTVWWDIVPDSDKCEIYAYMAGVGVGTSIETAALNSKKALMRPIGSHNDNANAAKMEKLLEDGINAIGLGPQGMGGKYSVMGVNIENTARHPSTIGVAVNVGCWSHRRGHLIVNSDLTVTCDTHSTWKFNA